MELNEEQIDYLTGLGKHHIHASNMLAKKKKEDISKFYSEYIIFHKAITNPDIKKAVAGFSTYKDFVDKHCKYSHQSKFASTILEEFICQILKTKFGNDVLRYGSVKAYSSLYFNYSGKESFKKGVDIQLNIKDQDVGIYKKEILTTESGTAHEIFIPLVCVECKTYIDKTMYEGSVATASKIKAGNPQCLFFIVTETYGIANNVSIELTQINNIYVLRKQKHSKTRQGVKNPIMLDVVDSFLTAISNHLATDRKPISEMISEKGYIRQ